MKGSSYQRWFQRASQNVEAALGAELSTPFRNVITEDYVRAAFMRGFALAFPDGAGRVQRESNVNWTAAPCVGGHPISGSGRPLQHDVGLSGDPMDSNDNGAILELKWLTASAVNAVAQDIWKLAITRTTMPEGSATRSYLAIGGDMNAIGGTLSGLRNLGLELRWSPAGRGSDWPRPSSIDLSKAIGTPTGSKALKQLLARGDHFREPPVCWARLRASLRARWYRRVDEFMGSEALAWRFLVWELDHRNIGDTTLDWSTLLPHKGVICPLSGQTSPLTEQATTGSS
jgi:hypothetical protein